jgi:arsenate reductase-like glutaredoxin family protein
MAMADSNQGFPEDVNTVPAEDGTTWVEIASTGTEDEAQLLRGFLEAAGIPAQIENVKFSMEPINFGTMGDIRVYVPSQDEARAQELLRKRDQEYERLDDDDETLVTDEGPAVIDETARAESDDNT